MNEELETILYKVGTNRYYVKSNCIKAYPASWRNTEDDICFNPESVLNTEYNNIHVAGGVKNLLDVKECHISEVSSTENMYSFKCFIEGYSFEVYGLTLNKDINNLYLGIRTISQAVGDTSLDITRVLAPYIDPELSAPECLDKPFKYDDDKACYVEDSEAATVEYLFRGLVFSTEPIDTAAANAKYLNNYFYTIQVLKDGEWNNTLVWPNVKAGDANNYTSVLLGDTDNTLIAPNDGMIAAGRYNSYTPASETGESTIFAVGLGDSTNARRNAFEVYGHATKDNEIEPDIPFETGIKSGPFKVTYNGELEAGQLNAAVSGVYTLNEGIEVAPTGSHIIINKNLNKGSNIGLHSYGHVNVIGSHLYFKDTDAAKETPRTIADFYVDNLINGSTVVDRGLFMTGIGDINQGAFVFRPGAVENSFTLKSINNESITLDASCSEIVIKNQNNLTLKDAELRNINEIKNLDAGFWVNNKLRFKDDSIEFKDLDYLKFNEILGDGSIIPRCALHRKANGVGQILEFTDVNIVGGKKLGAHISGVAGIFRTQVDAKSTSTNYETFTGAGIKFASDKKATTVIGDLEVTGNVKFGTMDVGDTNNTLITTIIDALYPIGSIYITMNDAVPPAFTANNMTWEQIAQGRTLIGVGTGIFNKVNNPGGQYNSQLIKHTHELKELSTTIQTTNAQWNEKLPTKTTNVSADFERTEGKGLAKDTTSNNGQYKLLTAAAASYRHVTSFTSTHNHGGYTEHNIAKHAHPILRSDGGTGSFTGVELNSGDSPWNVHWGEQNSNNCTKTDWIVAPSDADGIYGGQHGLGSSTWHNHGIPNTNETHKHEIPVHWHHGTVSFIDKSTDETGNLDAANADYTNLPPYLTCYIWKRTK